MRKEGATSQLDPPSLMPLSIAGCDQLQLRVAYQATSVALLQVVDMTRFNYHLGSPGQRRLYFTSYFF